MNERRSKVNVRKLCFLLCKHEYVSYAIGCGLDDRERAWRMPLKVFKQLDSTRGVESFSGEAV